MATETLCFHIKGRTPTIQHNGELANPKYKYTKLAKPYHAKRKKTEEDHDKIHEYEFKGSLYVKDAEKEKIVVWPGENIEAMIKTAAKRQKRGKDTDIGIRTLELWPLLYDGPDTREELWQDERFHFLKKARIGTSSVMRMRPKFDDWELKFELDVELDIFNKEDVINLVHIAGDYVGLSDWQRRYGLFEVVDVANGKI